MESIEKNDPQSAKPEGPELDLDLDVLEIDEDGEDVELWDKRSAYSGSKDSFSLPSSKEEETEEIEAPSSLVSLKEEYENESGEHEKHNVSNDQKEASRQESAQRKEEEEIIFEDSFDDMLVDMDDISPDHLEEPLDFPSVPDSIDDLEQIENKIEKKDLDLKTDIDLAQGLSEELDKTLPSEGETAFSREELEGGLGAASKVKQGEDFSLDIDLSENDEASPEPSLTNTGTDVMDDDSALAETTSILVENESEDAPIALTDEELSNISDEADKEADKEEREESPAKGLSLGEDFSDPSSPSRKMEDAPIALTDEELINISDEADKEADKEEREESPAKDLFLGEDFSDPSSPSQEMEDAIESPDDILNTGLSKESADQIHSEDKFPKTSPKSLSPAEGGTEITLSNTELDNIVSETSRDEANIDTDLSPQLIPSEEDLLASSDEETPKHDADHLLGDFARKSTEAMPILEAPPDITAAEAPEPDLAREQRAALLSQEISEESGLNKGELRKMISYLDLLFDKLPEDSIREFSRSEYFDLYKKIMSELGI